MTTSGHLEVDSAALLRAAGTLDEAGDTLATAAPGLRRRPDAGASTDEVATALAALTGAVAGMADHVGSLADTVRASAADFDGTDQAVGGAMDQRRGGARP